MDEVVILEKLNSLDAAKQFVQLLETRHSSNEELSQKLKLANKFLDRALITLAFDLQRKIESRDDAVKKIKITDEIISASELLQDVGDQFLNQNLHDLIGFAKNYENNFYKLTSNHDLLGSRVLVIIAERFS